MGYDRNTGDCVKIAINAVLSPEQQPDLVISGINHGPNLGADILYSGTVSCAMEGAMLGVPSIAMSLASMHCEYEDFKFAARFIASFVDKKLKDFEFPHKSILNINVPSVDEDDIGGIAITKLGKKMFTDNYEKRIDPRGKVYYWMAGELISEPTNSNTDIAAVRDNKISITPVTYEMTHFALMNDLEDILCKDNSCKWF